MNEDLQYQLDKDGNIDADYYINKARLLRSQYMTKVLTGMMFKLKTLFHIKLPAISIDRPAHH